MSTEPTPSEAAGAAAPPVPAGRLLTRPLAVITIGLDRFADDLRAQGVPVTHVQWQPPAGGNARLADLLAKLGG